MNQYVKTFLVAVVASGLVLGVYLTFIQEPRQVVIQENTASAPVIHTGSKALLQVEDFSAAAEMSVNSVVHVNVAVERQRSPWEEFFYGGSVDQLANKLAGLAARERNGCLWTEHTRRVAQSMERFTWSHLVETHDGAVDKACIYH